MTTGSWYWDSTASKLDVWLADSSSPATHTIEAATRVFGMRVVANAGEKSNLVIDGLTFERTGGFGLYFYSNATGGIGTSGIVIRNNTVRQTGTGTVDGGSYYNGIHFSEASELPTAPRFLNNTTSYTGGHGNGINCQNADNAEIAFNDASHFNHHGLDTKTSASVWVHGNVAHDSNGNGIYQQFSANGLIEQNVVYNVTGTVAGTGSGIQIDAGTSGARIYNNSIYNTLTGIYLVTAATAENNIVMNSGNSALEENAGGTFNYNDWGVSPRFAVNGTFYTFAQWVALGGVGNMAIDPLWLNPSARNFNLSSGSACIDAGLNIGLPYTGIAPDLGAFETP
jgi:hypothetical protein